MVVITAGDESTAHSVDTEGASVTDIVINNFQGILAEKDGTVTLSWADTDHAVFITVYTTALPKEQVLKIAQTIRYVPPEAAVSPEDTGVYRYSVPQIPSGYTLVEKFSQDYLSCMGTFQQNQHGNDGGQNQAYAP